MLLERFHNNLYSNLVDEISAIADGKSLKIAEYEDRTEGDTSEADTDLLKWSKLLPALKGIDLRPYIFISKEKAISFDQEQALTPVLLSMLERLESGALMNLNEVEKEMAGITPQEAGILFEKLLTSCQSQQDLTKQPNQMRGLYRIIKVFPQLEIKLMEFLSSKPASSLGVWVITESVGLQTKEARTKFNKLLDGWKERGNKNLKALAGQTSKLK